MGNGKLELWYCNTRPRWPLKAKKAERKILKKLKWMAEHSVLQLDFTSKTNKGCRRYYRDSSLVDLYYSFDANICHQTNRQSLRRRRPRRQIFLLVGRYLSKNIGEYCYHRVPGPFYGQISYRNSYLGLGNILRHL